MLQKSSLAFSKGNCLGGFTWKMIIGLFFYETITPTGPVTCSVTIEKYRQMLNNFVIPTV